MVCLGLIMFMLFLMRYTRPKVTKMYLIAVWGTAFSALALVVEFVISVIVEYPEQYYSRLYLADTFFRVTSAR